MLRVFLCVLEWVLVFELDGLWTLGRSNGFAWLFSGSSDGLAVEVVMKWPVFLFVSSNGSRDMGYLFVVFLLFLWVKEIG